VSAARTPSARPPASAPSRRGDAPARAAVAWLDVRGPYLLPLLLLAAGRAYFAMQIPNASEDAYITFRYAWNLAHGLGPVFNAGEHVSGFTSPPWMAWVALGLRLGADPVLWTRVTLWLADIVVLFTFGSLLARHASRASATCFTFFYAGWPFFAALPGTGIEMGAMLALIGLSAWLVDRRHPAAGAALGLLGVMRPEGLVAAGVLAVWASWRDRTVALAMVLAVAAGMAAYYGSPLPHSVTAKSIVYGVPGPLHAAAWWDWISPVPLDKSGSATTEGRAMVYFAVLMLPAAVGGARELFRRRTTALAGAAAGALAVWLGYLLSGTTYFFWYFATPCLCWALLASAGLPGILRGRVAYAALGFALLGPWWYQSQVYIGRPTVELLALGGAGDFIAREAAPGDTLMLEPAGIIGWKSPAVCIVDEVGLVTPGVAERRARGPGWYTDLVRERHPRWLIVRGALLRRGEAFAGRAAPFRDAWERDRTLAAYETVAAEDSVLEDNSLVVLRRRAGR